MLHYLRRAASWRSAAVALALLALASPYAHASAHANHHDGRHCELCVVAAAGTVPPPPAVLSAACADSVGSLLLPRLIPLGPAPVGPAVPRGPPPG